MVFRNSLAIETKTYDNWTYWFNKDWQYCIHWLSEWLNYLTQRGKPDDSWWTEPNEHCIILDSKRKVQSKSARLISENLYI